MSIKEEILDFVKKYKIFEENDSVLLGVSGGPDSIFMLYMLNELKEKLHFSISAAVFNHKLRIESDEEVDFVKNICSELGVKLFYGESNVKRIADKEKISIEEAARKERLNFLFKIKRENEFNKIALAHNKDDFVETVLIHIAKGSGLSGLSGIKPVSFNGIVHPILCVSRDEIEEYLSRNKINYRIDLTNYSLNYLRNRMRHQIVPLFTSINENFKNKVFHMGLLIMDEDNFLSAISEKDVEIMKTQDGFLLNIFLSLPIFEQRRIIKCLLGENADFQRVERVIGFLKTKEEGKMSLYGNLFLVKKKDYFFVSEKKNIPFSLDASYVLKIPGELILKELNTRVVTEISDDFKKLEFSRYSVAFDFDKIPLPLRIRFREKGDKIKLENGTKKIQDLFTDLKIPLEKRPYVPLLVDGKGNIIWAVGFRRSALYKIDSSTKRVIYVRISFMKNQFML
jgi:tRNA(Ile)-lysidine synthase